MEVIDMEVNYRNPKIYLLSGKARNGKDTTAEFLKKFYEADGKKVIYSRAGKYIKFYASEMTGWDGKEETKPRQLLQELGTDVIRNKLNKADMLIERQLDDIEIYSGKSIISIDKENMHYERIIYSICFTVFITNQTFPLIMNNRSQKTD